MRREKTQLEDGSKSKRTGSRIYSNKGVDVGHDTD